MLADACEARVRAERPHDEEQIRELIKQTISQRVNENELDYTDLTLRDLDTIARLVHDDAARDLSPAHPVPGSGSRS